jgi:hypothetical protein
METGFEGESGYIWLRIYSSGGLGVSGVDPSSSVTNHVTVAESKMLQMAVDGWDGRRQKLMPKFSGEISWKATI